LLYNIKKDSGTGKVDASIISCINYGPLRNQYNNVDVSQVCFGGIVGYSQGESTTVKDCLSVGRVYASSSSGKRKYVGGLVGRSTDNNGTITKSFYCNEMKYGSSTLKAFGTKDGTSIDKLTDKNKATLKTYSSILTKSFVNSFVTYSVYKSKSACEGLTTNAFSSLKNQYGKSYEPNGIILLTGDAIVYVIADLKLDFVTVAGNGVWADGDPSKNGKEPYIVNNYW